MKYLEPNVLFEEHPIGGNVLSSPLERLQLRLEKEEPEWYSGFNYPVPPGVLPSSLIALNFSVCFNQRIVEGMLPSSLQVLHLGFAFDHPISKDVLPQTLKELQLGRPVTNKIIYE